MMMMKAQAQAQPPVLVLWMHMLLLLTTMAALAVAVVQAQNFEPTQRSQRPTPAPTPTIVGQFPLYVSGTDLLLNVGGTNDITSGSPVQLNQNSQNTVVDFSAAVSSDFSAVVLSIVGGITSSSCYLDCLSGPNFRSLRTRIGSGETHTPQTCAHEANKQNFKYFALQYGGQCWADNEHPFTNGAILLSQDKCNMQCNSDTTQKCGGSCANQLYQFTSAVSSCYLDCLPGPNFRALRTRIGSGETHTPQTCAYEANKQGFKYFALQFGGQCFADNEHPITNGATLLSQDKCNMQCNSDNTQKCGGGCANQAYKLTGGRIWTFRSDGSITIPSSSSADGVLCLDSAHVAASLPSNQLILWACQNNNVNQKWTWNRSTGLIENTGTGYCVDASINGIAQLAVASCNENSMGQRFLPQLTIPIYVYGTNLLLNAWDQTNDIFSGSPVKLQDNVGTAPSSSELWTFQSDGTITTTTSTGEFLCLDSSHRAGSDYINQVKVWTCLNRDVSPYYVNQQWVWDRSTRTITNTGTGYCLDASTNFINPAAQLAVAPCNSNSIWQRFETYNQFQHSQEQQLGK